MFRVDGSNGLLQCQNPCVAFALTVFRQGGTSPAPGTFARSTPGAFARFTRSTFAGFTLRALPSTFACSTSGFSPSFSPGFSPCALTRARSPVFRHHGRFAAHLTPLTAAARLAERLGVIVVVFSLGIGMPSRFAATLAATLGTARQQSRGAALGLAQGAGSVAVDVGS